MEFENRFLIRLKSYSVSTIQRDCVANKNIHQGREHKTKENVASADTENRLEIIVQIYDKYVRHRKCP